MQSMTVQGTDIQIKEYQGKRVVTFKDIDAVHQRPEGPARKRFNDNKQRFISGVDFFKVRCSEVRPFFGQTPPKGFNPDGQVVLMTESGYLMLVKSFTDDLAWKVQRELVDTYFRMRVGPGDDLKEAIRSGVPTLVIATDKLIECARIMAGCLEGNRHYVLNILRNIIPDIDGDYPEDATPVQDVTERVSIAGRDNHYRTPFDHKKFDGYLCDNHISSAEVERMIGSSSGSVHGWRKGKHAPTDHFRTLICIKLGVPEGYFNGRVRRTRNVR